MYGQRLLPTLIDDTASNDPQRVLISFPEQSVGDARYRDVDFATFARAINRCSEWLANNVGNSDCFRQLAYAGPQDLRLSILVFAAIKTGNKVSRDS